MDENIDELLQKYIAQEKMYHFEGDTGVKNLNNIANLLGYKENGFRYGTSLEQFLSDNPGAQEALINWISDQNVKDWKEKLEEVVPEDDDE